VGADASSFRPIDRVYAKDKNAAYVHAQRVEGSDPVSFRVVDSMNLYCADRAHAFYIGSVMTGADGATFRRVRGDWYRDAKRLYWLGHKVVGADPESFQFFLTIPWMRDAKDVYRGFASAHSDDPNTFLPLNDNWGRDAKAYCAAIVPKPHPQMKVD
jgi:hypothetical protein